MQPAVRIERCNPSLNPTREGVSSLLGELEVLKGFQAQDLQSATASGQASAVSSFDADAMEAKVSGLGLRGVFVCTVLVLVFGGLRKYTSEHPKL